MTEYSCNRTSKWAAKTLAALAIAGVLIGVTTNSAPAAASDRLAGTIVPILVGTALYYGLNHARPVHYYDRGHYSAPAYYDGSHRRDPRARSHQRRPHARDHPRGDRRYFSRNGGHDQGYDRGSRRHDDRRYNSRDRGHDRSHDRGSRSGRSHNQRRGH